MEQKEELLRRFLEPDRMLAVSFYINKSRTSTSVFLRIDTGSSFLLLLDVLILATGTSSNFTLLFLFRQKEDVLSVRSHSDGREAGGN